MSWKVRRTSGSIPARAASPEATAAESRVPSPRIVSAARAVSSTEASVFLPRTSFSRRGTAFSRVWMSARTSSVAIVSISEAGLTTPSTWTTSGSSKARVTTQMASASRILARNWLPSPSPSLAPRTIPAISTNDTVAGTTLALWNISARRPSRASGRGTTPTFGSIVAKG